MTVEVTQTQNNFITGWITVSKSNELAASKALQREAFNIVNQAEEDVLESQYFFSVNGSTWACLITKPSGLKRRFILSRSEPKNPINP